MCNPHAGFWEARQATRSASPRLLAPPLTASYISPEMTGPSILGITRGDVGTWPRRGTR